MKQWIISGADREKVNMLIEQYGLPTLTAVLLSMRDITEKEISGSLCCDGFMSAISGGVFGCSPITSFSQNVGLIAMTRVVNRFCIMFGALAMILGGLFPPIGAFFTTLPDCVLGGCTVIMFGSIMMAGVKMMIEAGLDNRNTLIAATALCLGVGVTQVEGFFDHLPAIIGEIFAGNMVAGVFVVGLIMEILLPKDPAKYEAFMEHMDEALDIVDIDPNLMFDHVQEDHEKTE